MPSRPTTSVLFRALATAGWLALLGCGIARAEGARGTLHHELVVTLCPGEHTLDVVDVLTLPELSRGDTVELVLHAGLLAESLDEETTIATRTRPAESSSGSEEASSMPLQTLIVSPGPKAMQSRRLHLHYRGTIQHDLESQEQDSARGFSTTAGIIGEEGVFLAGSSQWIPSRGDELLTFSMKINLPPQWDAVSQGERFEHHLEHDAGRVSFSCTHPTEEIYLVAAPFTETTREQGRIKAQAFLRTPDPELAARYLDVTYKYLEMYEKLLGPYPYEKFAVVENFWETGYGMPSFTLLGPQVMRFPFILHSSYPHEILHNWWGNSVYVERDTGNWCEGLTAYLADHLVKEGQGLGAAYRRDTLEKYLSYVSDAKDFPLRAFRSRHSPSTEAIGYGKCLMLWHMIRRDIGDERFIAGLRDFYTKMKFKRASFDDLIASLSLAARDDLAPRFLPFVERVGAPELRLTVDWTPSGSLTRLSITVEQIQDEPPFPLIVPVVVTLASGETIEIRSTMDKRSAHIDTQVSRPVLVELDPDFDVFRRLDRAEIPSTISQLYGAENVTVILPGVEDPIPIESWATFAEGLKGRDPEGVQVVTEQELDRLPPDRTLWILGQTNRWAHVLAHQLEERGFSSTGETVSIASEGHPAPGHCFVLTAPRSEDPALGVGWVLATRPDALPGLARKLPHYGKYSWLAFEGADPTNVGKGQWESVGSPLAFHILPGSTPGTRAAREPLARYPDTGRR